MTPERLATGLQKRGWTLGPLADPKARLGMPCALTIKIRSTPQASTGTGGASRATKNQKW